MNHNPENSQQAVALIKFFTKKEHYLAFKNGSALFRPPHFYRKHDDKGRGDRSVSCLGYWDKGLGDEMPNLVIDGSPIGNMDAQSILIYPAHEQQDSWLQSWSVMGPHNRFEYSLERMLQEFGTYFVVLPATKIRAYAKLLAEASCSKVRFGLVQYSDEPLKRSLTVKDSDFCYQKEFRFFVGECPKDEVQEKTLHLKGLSKMLLEASSLQLKSPSGETRWCSLGHPRVVIDGGACVTKATS